MLVNRFCQGFIFNFSFLLTRQKFAVVMPLHELTVSLNSANLTGISTMNKEPCEEHLHGKFVYLVSQCIAHNLQVQNSRAFIVFLSH